MLGVEKCRYCGQSRTEVRKISGYFVFCNFCEACGPERDSAEEAIDAWNAYNAKNDADEWRKRAELAERLLGEAGAAIESSGLSNFVYSRDRGSIAEAITYISLSNKRARVIIDKLRERQPWQHCDRHSDAETDPQTSWACPECMREMRAAIRRIVGARHNTGALQDEIDRADELTAKGW